MLQLAHDQIHQVVHLFRTSIEVFHGKSEQRDNFDIKSPAPAQKIFELIGARAVPFYGIGEAFIPGKPPVSIDDQANMMGAWSGIDLTPEQFFVELVENRRHVH